MRDFLQSSPRDHYGLHHRRGDNIILNQHRLGDDINLEQILRMEGGNPFRHLEDTGHRRSRRAEPTSVRTYHFNLEVPPGMMQQAAPAGAAQQLPS